MKQNYVLQEPTAHEVKKKKKHWRMSWFNFIKPSLIHQQEILKGDLLFCSFTSSVHNFPNPIEYIKPYLRPLWSSYIYLTLLATLFKSFTNRLTLILLNFVVWKKFSKKCQQKPLNTWNKLVASIVFLISHKSLVCRLQNWKQPYVLQEPTAHEVKKRKKHWRKSWLNFIKASLTHL